MMTGICVFAIHSNMFESINTIFSLTNSFTVGSVKLILYCYFGEMISNSFKKLIDKLDKNNLNNEFNEEDRMYLSSIKELKPQLNFNVFGFELKRRTLLAITAFILQYAVIFIQTDSMTNESNPPFPNMSNSTEVL